jgi:hypothetical protein
VIRLSERVREAGNKRSRAPVSLLVVQEDMEWSMAHAWK